MVSKWSQNVNLLSSGIKLSGSIKKEPKKEETKGNHSSKGLSKKHTHVSKEQVNER